MAIEKVMPQNVNPRFFYGYVVVSACFFTMLLAFGAMFSFAVFLEPVIDEFGWTRAMTSAAFSLTQIVWGLTGMVMGRLNDRFGPRIIVVICGILSGTGYLLTSHIQAIWQLYLLYGVMIGIGMSGTFVPVLSTIARWFTKRRGLMSGITASGIGIGTVITPLVANWLISNRGWRTSYFVVGLAVLIVMISMGLLMKRDPKQMGQLPYGGEEVRIDDKDIHTTGLSFREAVSTRQLWILGGIYFSSFFFIMAVLVHIVMQATGLGISTNNAATILAIIGGMSILGVNILGNVGDRIGNKSAMITSITLLIISSVCLLVAQNLWMLYLFAGIFGLAYGGLTAVQSPITADIFGLKAHGVILGLIFFCGTLANASGPLFTGYIFDIRGSYYTAFLIGLFLTVAALILAILLMPLKKR